MRHLWPSFWKPCILLVSHRTIFMGKYSVSGTEDILISQTGIVFFKCSLSTSPNTTFLFSVNLTTLGTSVEFVCD